MRAGPVRIPKFVPLVLATLLVCSGLSPAQVPLPEDVLGFKVGEDYKLATYEQAVDYLQALERASRKIRLFDMGKTDGGRTMTYAVITSEDNMARLDHYKEISRKLALVRGLDDAEAHRLAAEGKAIVYIEGGVHADECAPAQSQIQLAYELVSGGDATTRFILDNVIFLLAFPNPDGMTLVSEWYRSNVGTPYEVSPMPWKFQKFAGQNINRDAYMGNISEGRNVVRLVNHEWYPAILYSHHQTAPFPARIWFPPAAEPTNPNLHPLFIRGKNLIGSAIGFALDERGQEGGISRFLFDFWYPGYLDSFCDYFHVVSVMTETALYKYATPKDYTLDDFPAAYKDFTAGAMYPSPWKGGWWRIRDAVEYCLTASRATLHTAASYRENYLYNRYQMGRDVIARFKQEPLAAWIIPREQWDPPTAARLLNNMILLGIDVSRAEGSFECNQVTYPAGTWVIPMDQPFALFVKAVFEEQSYPELIKYPALWQGLVTPQNFSDAYLPPYDITGWTLPYQFGVRVVEAPAPLNAALTPVREATPPEGTIRGSGPYYLLSPRVNNSFIAVNRILKQGGKVLRAQEAFEAAGERYPAGTMIVQSAADSVMEALAKELFLDMGRAGQITARTYQMRPPRIGLYMPWIGRGSEDEGWTRLVLERFEFPYRSVYDAEVRGGDLGKKFDALVFSSMSPELITEGNKKGTVPDKYVGGISESGVASIRKFVEEGGTLITLDAACLFALDSLSLPVRNVLQELKTPQRGYGSYGESEKSDAVRFACPGSILRMEFNAGHPVAYGMPEEGPGFFGDSPAFEILSSFEEKTPVVVAKYPKKSLLMSGYLRGEQYLQDRASAVEAPLGKGKVILLGFGVQQRAQPHGTFKLLFNSLYYGAYR